MDLTRETRNWEINILVVRRTNKRHHAEYLVVSRQYRTTQWHREPTYNPPITMTQRYVAHLVLAMSIMHSYPSTSAIA